MSVLNGECIQNKVSTRINKYICESGLYSRKASDRLIARGQVLINGRVAKLGEKVTPIDKVVVNGDRIRPLNRNELVCLALYKPVGVVCTASIHEKRNIVDFVGYERRIFPVGRLDRESEGLILLTNHSALVDHILNAAYRHDKEYLVTVNRKITRQFLSGGCASTTTTRW